MKHNFVTASQFVINTSYPQYLYGYWRACTTTLLYGPREIDKIKLAFEIMFELNRKSNDIVFVNTTNAITRYNGKIDVLKHLAIFTPEFESPDDRSDFADIVLDGMEQAASARHTKIFIIDSINQIAALSFGRNASPAYIMKRIMVLQRRYKISVLVLSDSTTKASDQKLIDMADGTIYAAPGEETPETVKYGRKPSPRMLSEEKYLALNLAKAQAKRLGTDQKRQKAKETA